MAGAERTFVGFYWTLPVPRVGFTRLSDNADEAAACSRTIRYQRDLVRHFVTQECRGRLVGEIVWLELSPDRGSEYVDSAVDRAFTLCRTRGAELVYVDFGSRFGWRAHHHLRHRFEQTDIPCHPIDPNPVAGDDFDPVRHFQQWRSRLEKLKAAQPRGKALWQLVLALIAPYLPPESSVPDYQSAAALLNETGIRTSTGRDWTRDNLRMFVNKPRTTA